ncbi:hypothetical protein IJI55_00825 [Candidatus Saccharibacteria bacterium]|nr:hypothetical protein [Candidatus Saccharibacteria bacterium]
MASIQDAKILERISQSLWLCKEKHKKPEIFLAHGVDIYYRAIKWMRITGICTIVLMSTGFLIYCLSMYFIIGEAGRMQDISIELIFLVLTSIATIVSVIIGYNLYRLSMTPAATLACLILLLFLEIVFASKMVVFFAVLDTIMAIIKWSTYRSWFYDLPKLGRITKNK